MMGSEGLLIESQPILSLAGLVGWVDAADVVAQPNARGARSIIHASRRVQGPLAARCGTARLGLTAFIVRPPCDVWTDPGRLVARCDARTDGRLTIVRRALALVPNPAAWAPDLGTGRTDGTGPYESAAQ